jgi:3-deoxy-D-arabino-heptulosonate 7-phosphate (DAHP) synthase
MKEVFLFQTYETIFDLEFNYFLIVDRNISSIKKTCIEYEIDEVIELKKLSNNKNENIILNLKVYWDNNRIFNGLPKIIKGGLIDKTSVEQIIHNIRELYSKIKQKTELLKTDFIDYLKEKGLDPIPSGIDEFSWYAKCCYSKGKHFMMVSTKSNTFGCGYCRKKGDVNDLKLFYSKCLH